jgi:hypothetical protein
LLAPFWYFCRELFHRLPHEPRSIQERKQQRREERGITRRERLQGGYQAILSLGFVDFTESLDFELVRFGQARFIDALEWIVSHHFPATVPASNRTASSAIAPQNGAI